MPEPTRVVHELAHEVSGDGLPIVFLHPIAMRCAFWRPVAKLLKDRFRTKPGPTSNRAAPTAKQADTNVARGQAAA